MSDETSNPTPTTSSSEEKFSISSMVQDNSGGISSMRVLMLLWGIGVFLVWGFAAVMGVIHGVYVFPSIPESVITILLGVTGLKMGQRFAEK